MGEEEFLRPAHAIFLSGCTARCTFCIASRYAFHPDYGVAVTPHQLADRIVERQKQGARSICFIGGEPVPHIPFILETLHALGDQRRAPVVFNSNFYMTPEALDLLSGYIDIFLPDLKFGPGPCGDEIGSMPDYWNVVTGCIDRALSLGGRVVVRHLLIPGHLDCCTIPVLRWLADRRDSLKLSLLNQYVAPPNATGTLASSVTDRDWDSAWRLANQLGLTLID